mgnify:CR=1 FL=1
MRQTSWFISYRWRADFDDTWRFSAVVTHRHPAAWLAHARTTKRTEYAVVFACPVDAADAARVDEECNLLPAVDQ